MAKKHSKKVRRIEHEMVKNGEKGRLHKVTAHYHHSKGKEGKGFGASMPEYHEPEETYHTTASKAHSHIKNLSKQLTATPEDEPEGEKEERSNDPYDKTDASAGEAD